MRVGFLGMASLMSVRVLERLVAAGTIFVL